jgi:tetratricopeptide (TPR) repeat protein
MNSTATRQRLQAAVGHHVAGRLREAIDIYREILRATPNEADVMQRLGAALAQAGEIAAGAELMAASLELQPDRPQVLLNLGRALLNLGRPQEALSCFDRAVTVDGASSAAFRMRGAALAALGRTQDALANLGQAVRLAPADPNALVDLGVALDSSGRAPDALACFERAIEIDPTQAPAHHNIGLLAARMGDFARALASFDQALALQPRNAALHVNRGTSLKELGRLPEALASFSQALSIEASYEGLRNRAIVNSLLERYGDSLRDYEALVARYGAKDRDLRGRGVVLLALGLNAQALALLERAAVLFPGEPDSHTQLGVALLRMDHYAAAVASFDRSLALKRDVPEVLNNRGVALAALDRADEALQEFIHAAAVAGDRPEAHTNMGVLFKSIGRYRQAALSFERALSVKHDDPTASFELAFLHLTLGELREGWPLYEARFRVPALATAKRDFGGVPRWHGTDPLAGKTILVYAEQGLGDAIQFARYVPLLREKGAAVVFEVMPQLASLLGTLPGGARIIARGDPIPAVDYHCPLLSLPLEFGTDLTNIPGTVRYLRADATRQAAWARRLEPLAGFRVGIAWQGNVQVERLIWARGRSMPLSALAPIAALPGVSLLSLQKGPGAEQVAAVDFRERVLDLGTDLDSGPDAFLDTAAVMANLDLVITTDTSIAHLAGALGLPTWVALNASPDWRWLLERSDTPWYPSLRLFRQPDRNRGWAPVVTAMAEALTFLLQEDSRG